MPDLTQAERPRPTLITDRRATVRFRCDPGAPGRLFITESYQCLTARVLDLCPDGIGLLLGSRVEIGTHVSVELEEGDRGETVELQAEAAHATPGPDGTWRCGFRLLASLSADELEVLSR